MNDHKIKIFFDLYLMYLDRISLTSLLSLLSTSSSVIFPELLQSYVEDKIEEDKRLLISYLVVNFVRVEIMFLFSYLHVLSSPHISNGHILLSLHPYRYSRE